VGGGFGRIGARVALDPASVWWRGGAAMVVAEAEAGFYAGAAMGSLKK